MLRSKAHWGYDQGFLAKCASELELSVSDLESGNLAAAEVSGVLAGVVHLLVEDDRVVYLDKLFLDPDRIGAGRGKVLFEKYSSSGLLRRQIAWSQRIYHRG